MQLLNLASLKAGGAIDSAGIFTGDNFRLSRQQLVNAIAFCDGFGDKTVGGGNDQQLVSLCTVFIQQCPGAWQQNRIDFFHQILFPPCLQLGALVGRQRF